MWASVAPSPAAISNNRTAALKVGSEMGRLGTQTRSQQGTLRDAEHSFIWILAEGLAVIVLAPSCPAPNPAEKGTISG